MSTTIDADVEIVETIGTAFKALIEERGDWREAHVSDVYGCDYSAHARRGADAKPVQNRDAQGALKMRLGTVIEEYVADGLGRFADARGACSERGERIAWNPTTGQVRRGLFTAGHLIVRSVPETQVGGPSLYETRCPGCPYCRPAQGEIIGHLDVTLRMPENGGEWLFEIKSTSLYGRMPASLPWYNKDGTVKGAHYIEQAATYGVAIEAARVGVLIVCRESGNVAGPFWLELDAPPPDVPGIYDPTKGTLRQQTIARAQQMLAATDPDEFPPDPKPRYAWQPAYCSLGDACACAGKA